MKVGFRWGPAPFHPGACLLPATVHGTQAVRAKGCLQTHAKPPSVPPWPPSVLVGAQSPEGAKVAVGWCVGTAPSMCIHTWIVTVPKLGQNFAPKSEPGVGREASQAPESTGIPKSTATAGSGSTGLPPHQLGSGQGSHLLLTPWSTQTLPRLLCCSRRLCGSHSR